MFPLYHSPAGIDYEAVTTNLSFNGSMVTQVVNIPILDDLIVDNDESFCVTLTTNDIAVTLRLQTTCITIRDNDRELHCTSIYISCCSNIAHILNASIIFPILEVTIGFNRAAYSVSEDAGNISAIVSVLSGTLARDVSVRVFTSDATATSKGGCDL